MFSQPLRMSLVIAMSGILLLHDNSPDAVAGDIADARVAHSEIWRDLLVENARAELDVGGLLIDFGTADQHKYTRGGWGTGWGNSVRKRKGPAYVVVDKARAVATMMLDEAPREVVLRARSRARKQRVEVFLDDTRLTRAPLQPSWRVMHFTVPKRSRASGRHTLRLEFRTSRGHVADIDWIWIRTKRNTTVPKMTPRMGPLRIGKRMRRALLAPTPRRYSFYLQVPAGGFLSLDYGARRSVEFRVHVQPAGGARRELFRRASRPGAWQTARIDLRQFSGRAVRLDLETRGSAGTAGWGTPELRAPARPRAAVTGVARPRHVILVVYDTTRADLFRPFNPQSAVKTPHFNALARRSTAFVNAYNNESWTRPSTVTILTGLYPDTHGALYARSVLSPEIDLLSEHMSRHGFLTAGIVGNPVLRPKFGLDQGWSDYRVYGDDRDDAANIYGEAIEWIEKHHDDHRMFLYIQSHDSHTPYEVDRRYSRLYHPEPYSGFIGSRFSLSEQEAIDKKRRRVRDRDMAWVRALYHGEATYQDEHFGRLIETLTELDILDDTLIIVTNDHGEEIRDHGGMGHGWSLKEEQVRAPLLIHYPPMFPRGKAVPEVVEHVDVAPTIADALGLPPLQHADGISMRPLVTGRGALPRPYYAVASLRDKRRAIRVGRWKLVVDKDEADQWRSLHDLEADPGEQHDRADSRPIAGRLCEVHLGESLASPSKVRRLSNLSTRQRFQSPPANLDDKTRRELEALGYFGDEEFEAAP